MAKLSGGEALVKSLAREGVEVVFGVPGIQVYGIVAGIRDEPGIRMVTTRHEQATTYMADGYARVSGKPGVALVVPGAGLYNAASGLATAYSRSSPVLMIAGQIPRGQIGKNLGGIHEVLDQADTVRNVTKWRRQVLTPRDVPDAVREAFRQMRTGRPRPVLIEMPPETGVERDEVLLREPAPVSRIVPSPGQLRDAARVIAESRLPLIFAGGGVALVRAQQAVTGLKGDNHDQDMGISIARRAMEEPLRQIVANSGAESSVVLAKVAESNGNSGFNAQTEEYGDMIDMGILDPTKVVRTALQNAASIAGLLITTEASVAEAPKDETPPAMPPGGGMDGMGMM